MSYLVDTFTTAWRAEAATTTATTTTTGTATGDRAYDEDVLPSVLARACARTLRYDGAGLSLMSGPDARVPLGASDETAAVAERLQYTVGEGPCSSAMRTGRAIVVTEEEFVQQWPVLAEQHFTRTPFRGGLSAPLRVGGSRIGVLDLYLHRSRALDGSDIIDAQDVAAAVTAVLLDTLREYQDDPTKTLTGKAGDAPIEDSATLSAWLDAPAARRRRQVWIATGMANLVLALPSDQALATLRAHAYASGQTLDTFADDVVTGRFDLTALGMDQLR